MNIFILLFIIVGYIELMFFWFIGLCFFFISCSMFEWNSFIFEGVVLINIF